KGRSLRFHIKRITGKRTIRDIPFPAVGNGIAYYYLLIPCLPGKNKYLAVVFKAADKLAARQERNLLHITAEAGFSELADLLPVFINRIAVDRYFPELPFLRRCQPLSRLFRRRRPRAAG